MRRHLRNVLLSALLLALPTSLTLGAPDARAQQVAPTPTGTLPPGPMTSPTLPPGPTLHQSTTIFTAVDGHWQTAKTLTLYSRVRFQLCINRSGLMHPAAHLRVQHEHNLPIYPVLYVKSMAHVSTRGARVCFASMFRLNKVAVRGKDVATFIVYNGRAPVIAFTRPFRVQQPHRRS